MYTNQLYKDQIDNINNRSLLESELANLRIIDYKIINKIKEKKTIKINEIHINKIKDFSYKNNFDYVDIYFIIKYKTNKINNEIDISKLLDKLKFNFSGINDLFNFKLAEVAIDILYILYKIRSYNESKIKYKTNKIKIPIGRVNLKNFPYQEFILTKTFISNINSDSGILDYNFFIKNKFIKQANYKPINKCERFIKFNLEDFHLSNLYLIKKFTKQLIPSLIIIKTSIDNILEKIILQFNNIYKYFYEDDLIIETFCKSKLYILSCDKRFEDFDDLVYSKQNLSNSFKIKETRYDNYDEATKRLGYINEIKIKFTNKSFNFEIYFFN